MADTDDAKALVKRLEERAYKVVSLDFRRLLLEAAAFISSQQERVETAERDYLRIHREKMDHFEARVDAEVRVKVLEGALGDLCDAWDDRNEGGRYRGNVTNANAAARAALSSAPAGEDEIAKAVGERS